LVLAVVGFGVVLVLAGQHIGRVMGPTLHELELNSSP
jgi:hypothetical protein